VTVTLNPFEGDQTALVPIGSAYSVTLGKMLDAGKTVDDSYTVLPYIRAANIQDDGLRLADVNEMPFSEDEAARLDLRRGDLLVVEGGAVGTTTVLDHDMPGWSFQKTVNRVRTIGDWSTRYLAYVLRAYRDAGVIDLVCNGSTIPHLTAEKLRALRIPSARPGEQRAIADYLDRETARIDTLIEEQQRLIEMLRERRASEIAEGFAEAATTPLRQVIEYAQTGPFGTQLTADEYVDSGVPVINPTHIRRGLIVSDDSTTVTPEKAEYLARYRLAVGDILLGRKGEVDKSALVDRQSAGYVCGSDAMALRPNSGTVPDYLWWFLQSAVAHCQLEFWSVGATVSGLNQTTIRKVRLPLPEEQEQRRITSHLYEKTAKIDALIAETALFIELSKERRSALITAAVTGQIDVRERV
jgi:type I restriction enzyme S subunit